MRSALRTAAAAALAAAALARMGWVVSRAAAAPDLRYYCGERQDRNVEAGHALLHGLPHEKAFWSMPAGTTANALMCRRAGSPFLLAAPSAAFALGALLVFGLGELLAGGLAGSAALALYAWTASPFDDRWLFTLSLLLVAYLAAWRARFPSGRKTLLLAAAIGFSLNVLSVLFLLPAALAVRERRSPRAAALLLLVPFLLLVPWTLASRRVLGRPVLLEAGRSDSNVITGALGLTRTAGPGPGRRLAGLAPGDGVPEWAALEAARHPARTLSAVARRLAFVFSLRPALLCAALLALALFRRREAHAALGLVVVYYLAVHCLMSVEERYFTPLWPLAAALAGSLAGLGRGEPEPRARRAWPAALAFVPLAGLVAYAHGLVLSYPSRSADPGAWGRELARGPDAWLLGAEGGRLLRAGRPAEAAAVLERALALGPSLEREQLLSWALTERDGRIGQLAARLARELEPELLTRQLVMHALARLKGGRPADAAADLARAAALQARRSASWEERAPAAARGDLGSVAAELIGLWPVADRVAIVEGLAKLPGPPLRTAGEEAHEAFRRAAALPREEALDALAYAERLAGADPGLMRGAAHEYARLGEPRRAVGALSRLAARRPGDLGLRLDLAALAVRAGSRGEALAALDEASRLPASGEQARRLADAWREAGEPRRAVAALVRLTAEAREPDDLAALARLRQQLGEHGRALALLDELVRREPGDARWRNDRGVSLLLLGRREEAAAELRAALERDPGLLSAALSLGTLLSSSGRAAEAREVYGRALAAAGAREPALRERILAEREAAR